MNAMERRKFLKVLSGAAVTTAVSGIGTLVEAQVALEADGEAGPLVRAWTRGA